MIPNRAKIRTLVIITFILSMGSMVGCGLDPCGNEELETVASPDGKRKAVVFQRDCGATTGFSTQISLVQANDNLPKEAGNTFIADTDHGQAPGGPGGGPKVNLQWTGERELTVKYDRRARVFRSEQSVEGVMVRYEPQ
jgi:hypothetical protein